MLNYRAMHWAALVLSIVVGVGNATFSKWTEILPELPNPINETISKIGELIPEIPDVIFQNKCIEDLGCFYTGPPFFHPLLRPISLTPTDDLKTKFLLYTPSNPYEPEALAPTLESLQKSSFDPEIPVKVLIHGYRTEFDEDDIRYEMKDALLNSTRFNVIIVNWTENNGPPYPQAVANARAVGAQVAKLLQFLIDKADVKAENIHVIGHSLGAQMAGWVGERIKGLGRITGLDPAGPYFRNTENQVRLDPTDAHFVDVIHSDGGENAIKGLGIGHPVGHMDFYPNGGRRQPGCVYTSESDTVVGTVVNATTDLMSNSCDHGRANDYFLESINNNNCRFLAVLCDSYDDFEKGECLPENSTVVEMGFNLQKMPELRQGSKFFLRTNEESAFCIEDSVHL